MSEIFSLDGVQTLKGKREREKKETEAAALRHSCLSWKKKKWDLKKFLTRYPAESQPWRVFNASPLFFLNLFLGFSALLSHTGSLWHYGSYR